MTLRKLISFLELYILYPDELGDVVIRNESQFCRYPLIKYFLSDEFQYDMHTAKITLENNLYPGVNLYFMLHRDYHSGDFSLSLECELTD